MCQAPYPTGKRLTPQRTCTRLPSSCCSRAAASRVAPAPDGTSLRTSPCSPESRRAELHPKPLPHEEPPAPAQSRPEQSPPFWACQRASPNTALARARPAFCNEARLGPFLAWGWRYGVVCAGRGSTSTTLMPLKGNHPALLGWLAPLDNNQITRARTFKLTRNLKAKPERSMRHDKSLKNPLHSTFGNTVYTVRR